MASLKLGIAVEKLRLAAPFRISGYVFEELDVVLVTLEDGSHRGRGEASGVYYLGDTALGNMVGSSLAMAPAFVLGQLCDVVDLDGPIFLAQDRIPGIIYTNGEAWSGEHVWGATNAASA
jgi:hypothetical protein